MVETEKVKKDQRRASLTMKFCTVLAKVKTDEGETVEIALPNKARILRVYLPETMGGRTKFKVGIQGVEKEVYMNRTGFIFLDEEMNEAADEIDAVNID